MGGVCFRLQDKVVAAADEDGGVDKGEGEEIGEMAPTELLLEPPDAGFLPSHGEPSASPPPLDSLSL